MQPTNRDFIAGMEGERRRREGEGEILAFVREIATQIFSANSNERPGIAREETPEYG